MFYDLLRALANASFAEAVQHSGNDIVIVITKSQSEYKFVVRRYD